MPSMLQGGWPLTFLVGSAAQLSSRNLRRVAARWKSGISVGIAPNKYLAKLATNAGKPDGCVEVRAEGAEAFLNGLALKDLWGIGEKTLQRLTELNIVSIRQLRAIARAELARLLGTGAAAFLSLSASGGDPGIFSEEPRSRSLSSETTFERDRKDRSGIERILLELCHEVAFRMLEEGWKSKTVSL